MEAGNSVQRVRHDLERVLGESVAAIEPFGSGHSGFTYSVGRADGSTLVVRLSPPGVRIAGPADIGRQGRIMSALHAAGVAVPRVLACSSEPAVDGRSFMVMELVDGTGWEEAVAAHGGPAVARVTIEAARTFSRLPVGATGIGDEPAVALADEIARWAWLLTKAPEHMHERGGILERRLRETAVEPDEPALVHGDFHLANLLYADGAVAAIVDWEIAEIGQPLLDLGSLVVTALRPRYAPDPNPTGTLGLTPAEIVELHGAPTELADWYTALSCFKYAAIFGYNFRLHRSGRRHDPVYETLQTTMSGLLDDGLAILEGGLDAAAHPVPLPGERHGS